MSLPSRGYAYVRRWIRILLPVRSKALRHDTYWADFDKEFGIGEGKTKETRPFDRLVISCRMARPDEIELGWLDNEVIKFVNIDGKLGVQRRILD